MKKFRIICAVERASGNQTWLVDADSREDALKRYKAGEGVFEAEEVEVTDLGEPDVYEATDIEGKTMTSFESLKTLVNDPELAADVAKAEKGQRAAATRVRKKMQEVKTAAQAVRGEVLEAGKDGKA